MVVKYSRNSHKEYDMFMQYIMNSRISEKVLYLYSSKKRKQEYITKIFMWVDKKYISDVRMWGKSHSIHKIIIKNRCGQVIEIIFRKQKKIVKNNRIIEIDNLKEKIKNQQLTDDVFYEYFESWKRRSDTYG